MKWKDKLDLQSIGLSPDLTYTNSGLMSELLNLGHLIDTLRYLATALLKVTADNWHLKMDILQSSLEASRYLNPFQNKTQNLNHNSWFSVSLGGRWLTESLCCEREREYRDWTLGTAAGIRDIHTFYTGHHQLSSI